MADNVYSNKKQIIKKLLILIIISHWPAVVLNLLYLFRLIGPDYIIAITILYFILEISTFGCCFYIIRQKDDTTNFDISWIRLVFTEWAYFVLLILGLLIANYFAVALMKNLGFPLEMTRSKHLPWGIILILIVKGSFVAPVAEELFWRGYVQWNLRKIFSPKTALIGQAAVFSLLHFYGITYIVSAFMRGILFGIWREKRKTLLPIMLAHIIVNTLYYSRFWNALLFSN